MVVLPQQQQPQLDAESSKNAGNSQPDVTTIQVDGRSGIFVLPLNSSDSTTELSLANLESISTAFLGWLRGSLGLDPDLNSEGCHSHLSPSPVVACTVLPPISGLGFRNWEIDAVARSLLPRWRIHLIRQIEALSLLIADGAAFSDEIDATAVRDLLQEEVR